MTRINCIPPQELTGPHLVAEYRELPRIFTLARAAIERGEQPDEAALALNRARITERLNKLNSKD